jgi:hypothetical protein
MPFWILPVIQSSARKEEAMINALGLLEVDGMVAAVDAADAMLKAANVRLLSHEVLDPGRLTLVVEGDLAACRAALDAEALRQRVQARYQPSGNWPPGRGYPVADRRFSRQPPPEAVPLRTAESFI